MLSRGYCYVRRHSALTLKIGILPPSLFVRGSVFIHSFSPSTLFFLPYVMSLLVLAKFFLVSLFSIKSSPLDQKELFLFSQKRTAGIGKISVIVPFFPQLSLSSLTYLHRSAYVLLVSLLPPFLFHPHR